ncbi:MAG: DUF1257 domain-containing protein [Cyanobium sp. M30B3]|nr:MAG: DUF1257 domain-containing protein [Cyanobium sp. M30B3]
MSHLSILPTVLHDADVLAASLEALGLRPRWGGHLEGFAGERQPVLLQVRCGSGHCLGWRRQADGSLALVGDLQRLSSSQNLQQLLARITRRYAASRALADAQRHLPGAQVSLIA